MKSPKFHIIILVLLTLCLCCCKESGSVSEKIASELPKTIIDQSKSKKSKQTKTVEVSKPTKEKEALQDENKVASIESKTHKGIQEQPKAKEQAKSNQPTARQAKTSKTKKKKVSTAKKKRAKKSKQKKDSLPKVVFEKPIYSYDTITEGDIVKHNFIFTNDGEGDLEISKTEVSCGCTVPSYPFLAIPPGGKGKIGAVFNSVGKHGEEESTIEVFHNGSEEPILLTMKGYVQDKKVKSPAKK